MKTAQLNDAAVRGAKAQEKRYIMRDGRGLVIEIMPSGSKIWRLITDICGRRARITIGRYPDMPLSAARREAANIRASAGRGEKIRAGINAVTFADAAKEWLTMRRTEGRLSEITIQRHEFFLNKWLNPAIGNIPADKISASDALRALKECEKKGSADMARRVRITFGKIAAFCAASGYSGAEMAAAAQSFAKGGVLASHRTKPFAAITSESGIRELLAGIDAYSGIGSRVRAALLTTLYTAARPGMIRNAEWREIDLKRGEWTIPPEKMKTREAHKIPLSRQCAEILRGLWASTGGGRYVFTGHERPLCKNTMNKALEAMNIPPSVTTVHGFRKTFSTIANERLRARPDVIEAALAHKIGGVRGIYNLSVYFDERAELMQRWADWLDALRDSGADSEHDR